MDIIKQILNSFVFWGAWIIIPILMEIIPAIGSVVLLLRRQKKVKSYTDLELGAYPEISIIVPVYNSQDTLFACIKSIYDSSYPNSAIRVFLVDNQGKDDSFSVFNECQHKFPELKMQWLNAAQGKSRALNMALYNSEGKYIINIDSDGVLEKDALANLVRKYEANPDINCMTGAIMTTADMIEEYKGFFPRLLRKLEFMEYAQAFLAGRSYASEINMVYTLSGAFSSFRKSAILKSWMYNTDTVGEDTHLTFQMRYQQKERVEICENAIFYVDPVESVNKLYTQRQRWQRGSLEVAHMFAGKEFHPGKMFTDINVRTLMYDHTFAFPRMIWYFALICLIALNFSAMTVLLSTVIIYGMYIAVGFFYFVVAANLLKIDPYTRKYYLKHWWCVPLLPLYNLFTFFIRFAGIINSIGTTSSWRTMDFTDEGRAFVKAFKEDELYPANVARRIRGWLNVDPYIDEENKRIAREKAEKKKSYPVYSAIWYVLIGLIAVVSILVFIAVDWSKKTFGVEINEIINTLKGPIGGTEEGMKTVIISGLVIPVAIACVLYALFILLDVLLGKRIRKNLQCRKRKYYMAFHKFICIVAAFSLIAGLLYANMRYDLITYYAEAGSRTTVYEDYYVSPADVAVSSDKKTKNLIYIYVESLETTYASKDDGGAQSVNYMPGLTKLAKENISFSDNGKLGGFHMLNGTNWTMAALFATTTGIPLATSEGESSGSSEMFMPGVLTLGDILDEHGYVQEFLCGSDGNFADRKKYFEQHGNYNFFDVFSAKEAGYIPKDYWVNWGIEDVKLFDIAKTELTNLASEGKPFNFTMLTVDLHAKDGYMCEYCGDDYENITANVIDCNDRVITEFVEWCKAQDFYKDTMIVITGDHPRMDTSLVGDVDRYKRTVYNCFINPAEGVSAENSNRVFTSLDIFPTVLAGLGFNVEGERLGLGTNLFSGRKTMAEEKGFDWLYSELSKSSGFYNDTFTISK